MGRLRHACTFLLSGLLGVLGLVAAVRAGTPELVDMDLPLLVVLGLMVPAYIAGHRYTLDFELRREAHAVTLVQLPLALGVLLIAPLVHLAARVVSALVFALIERQAPMKAAYNFGVATMEVGVAALAVSLVDTSGPTYWLALYAGLVVGDIVGALTLGAIWRLLDLPGVGSMTLRAMATTAPVSLTFTGVAVVSVTALEAELWTAPVLLGLVAGLVLAYRAHRRIVAQQHATELLYDFVKDLGPLDLASDYTEGVLQRIRALLHTRRLDLAVLDGGHWHHLHVSDDGGLQRSVESVRPVGHHLIATEPALLRRGQHGSADTMATPMRGTGLLSGILSATERLGAARGFDMRDLRLLETVGSELSTALERGRLLADLGRAATTDALTGLPNLAETSTLVAGLLRSSDTGLIVSAIAVDSFREVNDTLGHEVGDELLLQVTQRLIAALPDAIVGRIGGGRFAVVLPRSSSDEDPELIGLALRAKVEGRAQLGAVGTHIKLSVGIAVAPDHGLEAATLLRRAETAMYSARHAHGGPVLWEPAYEVTGTRRLAVVTALREALSSGAIGVSYQPKISAASGQVTGVEALARWTHPALGAITPDEFVPLAEASGLMGPLTTTVLRQSLTAAKGWQRRAGAVGVAVNVSADSVLDPSFITEVAGILASVGVEPGLLTLELTETVLLNDPVLAATRIGELRSLGVKLSVDDFGTGYSSLTYLKGLPVDEVKIDKGFVRGLVDDPADRAVVRAVVDIAHTLGLRVVAEGVEHEGQNGILRALGVDEVQGFLHARPMPALEVSAWLRSREISTRI